MPDSRSAKNPGGSAFGAGAAFGGVARASYLSLGDPITGMGMELDAIIAVLLGGTSFFGGEGSVARTIVAVLILTCLAAGIQVVAITDITPIPHNGCRPPKRRRV